MTSPKEYLRLNFFFLYIYNLIPIGKLVGTYLRTQIREKVENTHFMTLESPFTSN